MATQRILRSRTIQMRELQENKNNKKQQNENEESSEHITDVERTETISENSAEQKENRNSPPPKIDNVPIAQFLALQQALIKNDAQLQTLLSLVPQEKLKNLDFNFTIPPHTNSDRKTTSQEYSLPNIAQAPAIKENKKPRDEEIISKNKSGAVKKIVKNFENRENSKDETFEINSFIGTNKRLLLERKRMAEYDEFLKTERKKLREREKILELNHREIIKEKYRPSAHSSLNKHETENRNSENYAENIIDRYLENDNRRNEQKNRYVHFQEENYNWPESSLENRDKPNTSYYHYRTINLSDTDSDAKNDLNYEDFTSELSEKARIKNKKPIKFFDDQEHRGHEELNENFSKQFFQQNKKQTEFSSKGKNVSIEKPEQFNPCDQEFEIEQELKNLQLKLNRIRKEKTESQTNLTGN